MKPQSKILAGLTAILISILFIACQKDGPGHLSVRMTDAPGDYDSVCVDVESVEIHYSGGTGWTSVNTNAGIYDLLLLQDSVSVLIADQNTLPSGDVTQMRLILGDDNYVVIDSTSHPLLLSSQDKTGLKINLNTTINPNDHLVIVLDFDAGQSVVEEGNDQYRLKPVLFVDSLYYQP